jgi:hypothetical protein
MILLTLMLIPALKEFIIQQKKLYVLILYSKLSDS